MIEPKPEDERKEYKPPVVITFPVVATAKTPKEEKDPRSLDDRPVDR